MLNKFTLALIQDLKNDIKNLELKGSNIEVIWELEKMQNRKILLLTSKLIKENLNN